MTTHLVEEKPSLRTRLLFFLLTPGLAWIKLFMWLFRFDYEFSAGRSGEYRFASEVLDVHRKALRGYMTNMMILENVVLIADKELGTAPDHTLSPDTVSGIVQLAERIRQRHENEAAFKQESTDAPR